MCQQNKAGYQKPPRLLHPLKISKWQWDHITNTRKGKDAIWVIVDKLIKSAHFLSFKKGKKMDYMAQLYVSQIVRLHGAPLSIVSDRGNQLISRF